MSAAAIVALDGVLANHKHRRVTEEADIHWQEKFNEIRVKEDAPNRALVQCSNNCASTTVS